MRTETVTCDRCGKEAGPLDRVTVDVGSDHPETYGAETPSRWTADLCWSCWIDVYREATRRPPMEGR